MGDLGEMQKYGSRIRFLGSGVGNINMALRLYFTERCCKRSRDLITAHDDQKQEGKEKWKKEWNGLIFGKNGSYQWKGASSITKHDSNRILGASAMKLLYRFAIVMRKVSKKMQCEFMREWLWIEWILLVDWKQFFVGTTVKGHGPWVQAINEIMSNSLKI